MCLNYLQDSQQYEIDLHGLYVKEAIVHTEQAIREARQRGDPAVHLIVGAYFGLHYVIICSV
jgi:DNA-nicking Smr family endonuclease